MSGSTVPTELILNANPAWVRQGIERNLGPLIEDISKNKNKIQVPVLLAPDYLVIDGARRVCAAQILGLKRVPVVMTSDWDTILRHLTLACENAGPTSLPWSWLEIDDLLRRVLSPLYQETRVKRMVEARQAKQGRRREANGKVARPRFIMEVAAALGLTRAVLQAIQDCGASLIKARELDPGLATRMTAKFVEIERSTHAIFSAQRMLRDMYRTYLSNVSSEPDRRIAQDQERAIGGIVEVLGHVKKEALSLTGTPLNPAVSADELRTAVRELTSFRMQMRAFTRHLNEHIGRAELEQQIMQIAERQGERAHGREQER